MKILHVSKYYFPYIGGVENICKYLVEGTRENVTAVVCFNENRNDTLEEVNGHKVWRVGTWVNIARQALSPAYPKVLREAIHEFKPDIIHFHWANPFPAAVLLAVMAQKMKLVVHWHMDIIKQKKIYPLVKPIERKLLERADLLVVTSPPYRDHSVPLRPFKAKVRILPCAIDEEKLALREGDEEKTEALRKGYGDKPIVFFVGRHIQYKGLPHLIEAERGRERVKRFLTAPKMVETMDKYYKEMMSVNKCEYFGGILLDSLGKDRAAYAPGHNGWRATA